MVEAPHPISWKASYVYAWIASLWCPDCCMISCLSTPLWNSEVTYVCDSAVMVWEISLRSQPPHRIIPLWYMCVHSVLCSILAWRTWVNFTPLHLARTWAWKNVIGVLHWLFWYKKCFGLCGGDELRPGMWAMYLYINHAKGSQHRLAVQMQILVLELSVLYP